MISLASSRLSIRLDSFSILKILRKAKYRKLMVSPSPNVKLLYIM